MTETSRHLTDEEIVTRLDEPDPPREARAERHLATCAPCRVRLAAMEDLFAGLRADPPPAGEAELAARRDRILAAVATRPPVRRLPRWTVWVPLTAAAAVAAFLIGSPFGSPREDRSGASALRVEAPGDPPATAPAAGATLAVVAEASRAAEEVLAEAGTRGARGLVHAPPIDAGLPVGSLALDDEERIVLQEEFAALPTEDREAILEELATVSFEL